MIMLMIAMAVMKSKMMDMKSKILRVMITERYD